MASLDLRASINAISDVVNNRPKAKRKYDQIYMKIADMLLHTEHVSRHVVGKDMLFVGDGDAIGLCLVHLDRLGHLKGPDHIHLLDFDPGIVNSVLDFAKNNGLEDRISAELYNVRDPLPEIYRRRYSAFHINPPFGKSNNGRSVSAFMRRGFESLQEGGTGCVVIADHDGPDQTWTQEVLKSTQLQALQAGFVIAELLPKFHRYHLDDVPGLTSCSMILRQIGGPETITESLPLTFEEMKNFYGTDQPLDVATAQD